MGINNRVMIGASYGLLAALIWGGWPVVSKLATHQNIGALDITALRFGVAGCLLLPVVILRIEVCKQLGVRALALAIGAGAPYVLLAMWGLEFAPSAHFGIIAPSSMLIFSTIGGILWFNDSLNRWRLLGAILILSGIFVVGINSLQAFSFEYLLGDVMFVGCGLLWASYTLLSKYWQVNPWTGTSLVAVISMVLFLPLYLSFSSSGLPDIAFDVLLFQGFFQGVLTAIAALYFYSKAVEVLGSAKGAIFSALVPPTTLILGTFVLKESMTWVEVTGLLFVSAGMLLSLELISPKMRFWGHLPTVSVVEQK